MRLSAYFLHLETPDLHACYPLNRKSNRIPEEHLLLSTEVTLKPLTIHLLWTTTNCGKFLNRWEYQTLLRASWETCMQVKKQQFEPDMEQPNGSKLGKEYIKAVYCHPAYLMYMQSTSCEMLCWMKQKLESRLLGELSTTSDKKIIPL